MKVLTALIVFVSLNAIESSKMDCIFAMTYDNLYSCTNHNLNIEKNGVQIKEVNGHHLDEKQDVDVAAVYFLSAGMKRLPRNVFKVFKNMTKYVVHGLDTVTEYLDSEALVHEDFWGAKSLNSLYFTSVVLEHLRARVFEGAENLVYMTFESCHITSIDKEAFKGLRNLQSLGLKYNYISTIEGGTFSDQENLQHLLLSGNFLRSITKNDLKGMKKLSRLALIGNLLEDISENLVEGLKELEFLYLDQNICIDEHFGVDGVPFSKLKKMIVSCSKERSPEYVLKKKEDEISQLEKEIALLQRQVEKHRRGNCLSQTISGARDLFLSRRKEMP